MIAWPGSFAVLGQHGMVNALATERGLAYVFSGYAVLATGNDDASLENGSDRFGPGPGSHHAGASCDL